MCFALVCSRHAGLFVVVHDNFHVMLNVCRHFPGWWRFEHPESTVDYREEVLIKSSAFPCTSHGAARRGGQTNVQIAIRPRGTVILTFA